MDGSTTQDYRGFEQGPIRPPSEANSLLLRVTRNCPWNHCTFCAVYKDEQFTPRPLKHIIRDIDQVHAAISLLLAEIDRNEALTEGNIHRIAQLFPSESTNVFYTAVNWFLKGEGSVFLQDADSLVLGPDQLIEVLGHLKGRFPWVTRITSYARSQTINRISSEKLLGLASAGLDRIHIGMESGSKTVLKRVKKGVTRVGHISAGRKVRECGIELSEYVMPGLGGRHLTGEHALETADALNQINPDFIRLRTLSVTPGTPLYDELRSGVFERCTDLEIAREIRLFIDSLDGISATVKSDHFYNLLQSVEGNLPEDKEHMLGVIDAFLDLPAGEQVIFQLGRRMGYFQTLADMHQASRLAYVESVRDRLRITPENIDEFIAERQNFSV